MPEASTAAIVGVGNIGRALARDLSRGSDPIVLAGRDAADAKALADELGPLVRAASVENAIADADAIVFALWLDDMKEVIPRHRRLLEGKVVVDPSNPVSFATGSPVRTLPEGQSSASIVASLLPPSAHYVKAFGTLAAPSLAGAALRQPLRAVLFYATDDEVAATTAERLIRAAGFDPLKVGGLDVAGRIEMPGGDLHQFGLNGEILDLDQARAALASGIQPQ
ncbi:MAG TPA: NAD(P)-binding domain-containing protein [Acidimicrobiales bacterium]